MASINIGETLREARKKKNISLDELQQKTKIQKRYLAAIEENDFSELPSKFYARNFIRQYAAAVGVDGQPLVDVYDGKDQAPVKESEPEHVGVSRKVKHEDPRALRLQASLPAVVLGLIAVAIIAVVGYTTWLDHKEGNLIASDSSMQVEGSTGLLKTSSEKEKARKVAAEKKKKAAEKAKAEAKKTKASKEKAKAEAEKNKTPEQRQAEKEAAEKKKQEAAEVKELRANLEAEMKKKTKFKVESNTVSDIVIMGNHIDNPTKLTFKGKIQPVWIGVMVNNQLIYQHTLQPNETVETEIPEDTAQALITLGVADRASIKVNDHKLNFHPGDSVNQKNIHLTLSYKPTEKKIDEAVAARKAAQQQARQQAEQEAQQQQSAQQQVQDPTLAQQQQGTVGQQGVQQQGTVQQQQNQVQSGQTQQPAQTTPQQNNGYGYGYGY
ncbi:helix-turn-helix domain-containing protein [Enterococcus sp. CSURQ0835]|uniref:helix-turn-helix domain-containing protein n=1 Tax=Enterococcus sp. CSURQ0835 TaxID=2681394 RepID=UPI001359C3C8|nr:helix-turn-helix domain-containing protein [Enterococcus sp. CSURQ0835]